MKFKLKPQYTLYRIKVPYVDHPTYMHFLTKFPKLDVNDFYENESILYVGISYDSIKEQEKLLKKLTKELKKYYKD